MTGVTWDAVADRKLFLGIIAQNPSLKIDKIALAALLSDGDVVCTASAIDNRLKRIRASVKTDPAMANFMETAGKGGNEAKGGHEPKVQSPCNTTDELENNDEKETPKVKRQVKKRKMKTEPEEE